MDPLADVLDMLRVRGAVMGNVRAQAPWGIDLPPTPGAAFHAVTAGSCWLRVQGAPPRELLPGDVVLLPTGAAHRLSGTADGRARQWDRIAKEQALTPGGEIVLEGTGATAHFICAAYGYDHEVAHPLLSLLPPVLHIPADQEREGGAVQTTLRLLRHELTSRRTGAAVVVDRLIDVLFVHVVRTWIETWPNDRSSWLRALRDPAVARVIALLHERPASRWTLDTLAQESNLSRATLVRRFAALVGEPPLAYLTRWRMDLAARRLRDTDEPVGAIARHVGYSSEFAFSRAFSRARGRPPGRFRAEARVRARDLTMEQRPAAPVTAPG